jgi:hypothetical protein
MIAPRHSKLARYEKELIGLVSAQLNIGDLVYGDELSQLDPTNTASNISSWINTSQQYHDTNGQANSLATTSMLNSN